MRKLSKKKAPEKSKYVPDVTVWVAMNLSHKRRATGLTQGQLAKKAQISFRNYQSIETAATDNVTVKTLSALAKALGLDIRDLLKPRKDYVRV